ncbi:putative 26S proteasome regulatory complex, ATPase RPT2 [Coccomyxa subellipsoidea C-169]|uniref:26S proteasome regulatory complex, ATPase RPT2 n=1 Tax=Coccomyxa subellipsoidea (strain C-169) TaxID=574566 RepID=I0YRI9_COCSC|nr:putative 26S proteasome regulatory complex, ATPase RPT2 [Coccomyxa subellipsoidea C-169]EIE21008.1 putative 26S proteasome regulatory complex, ATPase RPT2 [Coccomyxa subellipsoidea C-169]|eukprot:XP_005645552.1 putative 26S proteasome regulatory complex, ATPase RPT2 [Coccomyxa subellipsoidea C-169]
MAALGGLQVDLSVSFDQVGGLDHYIRALKEMVFLPLVYPELFERFHISPPRGVLFYGPPGTGKTLVARALAATASRAGRKVAFFMRKGADVLSKWVGEAERQLRMLFEEAQRQQPAIIFFDEIDGLAPVRSSKQDQIHNSIVSTLLALMDGLDSRGSVVVIGATNRVDALDAALRRPGRFDRELVFPLPSLHARASILDIHTRAWAQPPGPDLLDRLAQMCVGYCGADLKALCTEASLQAMRRHYPQIYDSDEKLLIDPSRVTVSRRDFLSAFSAMTPASHRSATAHARSSSLCPFSPVFGTLSHCLCLYLSFWPSRLSFCDPVDVFVLCQFFIS